MRLVVVSVFCIAVLSCKEAESLKKVFDAHGGLATWKNKRTLSFEMTNGKGIEKQTIDLRSRNEKIEMPDISMGSNGTEIWLLDENEARISYDDGVGLSAKDEYYVYYNSESFRMEWLGYTVTFRSGEKSDNVKWIHYNDWMNVEELLLPKSLTWHDYEGRTIKSAREPRNFENVSLTVTALPTDFFVKPSRARIVKDKME